jgi:ankyrin repeat protein
MTGGSIYQWTLAFNSFPHQVAAKRGHHDLAGYLWDRSDSRTRFLVACVSGKRPEAEAIATANPGLAAALDEQDLQLPAKYCWETNVNFDAVKLMLDLGFPVSHPERNHGYTPLHNAAWSAAGDIVELLIERGHPVDVRDPQFHATPLQWAEHCCRVEKRHPDGDYGRVARALLKAGSPVQDVEYPTGNAGMDDALRPYRG